jgi:hypothetical protein
MITGQECARFVIILAKAVLGPAILIALNVLMKIYIKEKHYSQTGLVLAKTVSLTISKHNVRAVRLAAINAVAKRINAQAANQMVNF